MPMYAVVYKFLRRYPDDQRVIRDESPTSSHKAKGRKAKDVFAVEWLSDLRLHQLSSSKDGRGCVQMSLLHSPAQSSQFDLNGKVEDTLQQPIISTADQADQALLVERELAWQLECSTYLAMLLGPPFSCPIAKNTLAV